MYEFFCPPLMVTGSSSAFLFIFFTLFFFNYLDKLTLYFYKWWEKLLVFCCICTAKSDMIAFHI